MVRQHVNPLSARFQQKIIIPKWSEIYADISKPFHIDIGCAKGNYLLTQAQENPDLNYLGLEIRESLVDLANSRKGNLENIHFLFCNANLDFESIFKSLKNVDFISILNPDPWFKEKHKKRRVINQTFVNLLEGLVDTKTKILVQTDVEELMNDMDKILSTKFNLIDFEFNMESDRERAVLSRQEKIFKKAYQIQDYRQKKNEFKNQIMGQDYDIKTSSQKSIIYSNQKIVLKDFHPHINRPSKLVFDSIKNEVDCLLKVRSPYLNNVVMYSLKYPFIVYQYLEPLPKIISESILLKVLSDVAKALNDLHSNDYIHRDVYFNNIGYSHDLGHYVLFDTETIKFSNDKNQKYNDFKMFFDNLRESFDFEIIDNIFNLIDSKITKTQVLVKSYHPIKKTEIHRELIEYDYDPKYFIETIHNI